MFARRSTVLARRPYPAVFRHKVEFLPQPLLQCELHIYLASDLAAAAAMNQLTYTPIKGRPCRIMWAQRDPFARRSGVGNLCFKNLKAELTARDLWETCSMLGPVLSVKVATSSDGKSLGYAYLQYESEAAAKTAADQLNEMGHELGAGGKPMVVERYVRKADRVKSKSWTNVFIKNLPPSWNKEKLSEVCSRFGKITSLEMPMGEDGKYKGFGFCNFESQAEAEAAVTGLNDMEVTDASSAAGGDKKEDGAGATGAEESRKLYAGRFKSKVERLRELRAQFQESRAKDASKNANLYVRGLPENFDDEALRKLFGAFGSITSAKVARDSKLNVSRGYGYVAFSSREEAEKAKSELSNRSLEGKPLYVNWHETKEAREARIAADKARVTAQASGAGRGYAPATGVPAAAVAPAAAAGLGPAGFPGAPGFGLQAQQAQMQQQAMLQQMLQLNPMMAAMIMQSMQGGAGMMAMQPGAAGPAAGQPGVLQARPGVPAGAGPAASGAGAPRAAGAGMPGMAQPSAAGPAGAPRPAGAQPVQIAGGAPRPAAAGQPPAAAGARPAVPGQPMPQAGMARGPAPAGMQQPPAGAAAGARPGFPAAAALPGQQPPRGYGYAAAAAGQRPANVAIMPNVVMPQGQAAPQPAPQPQPAQPLDDQARLLAQLKNASKEQQRNLLGERLYPKISAQQPQQLAGKITGMLLEMDTSELLHLLDDRDALKAKIDEAVAVLNQVNWQPRA